MWQFLLTRGKAFQYAFSGFWFVIRTQRNAWIHTLASLAVILVGVWIQLPARDWAVIAIAFALVWITEVLNTALEAVVDLLSPQYNSLAKTAKDVGAAAVLIAAISSILIGLLILGPPVWQRFLVILPARPF